MVAARLDRCAGLLLLLAWLAAPAPVHAQPPERAIEFEDLGLTGSADLSARTAGLAGFVSPVNDVTALVYNAAGLTRIKPRVAQLGFTYDTQEIITAYGGSTTGLSSSRGGLLFAGGAIPIPVFRGSMVPAVAVHRMFTSDLDLAYEGYNAADDRNDAFRIEQSGATYAFSIGFGVDLASVLSAGMSMSVFEGGYQALRQSHTHEEIAGAGFDRYVVDDIDADLDGVVGRVGMMLYAHRHLHIGVHATLPTLVNHTTTATGEITEVLENSSGSTVQTASTSATEYIIPYRLDGGIAMPWGDWLLTVQGGTRDWSEGAVDKGRLRLQNGNAVLGRTIDVRAGVEWTAPWWPLRLRGGVATAPFALEYLQADRIDNDQLEEVTSESTPIRFSFGAGIAMKRTILIDASFTRTRGDRSTTSLTEERTWSQIILEGSYWF